MKEARIYLVQEGGKQWIPMSETPYALEVDLQQALIDYPDLLPGDQINPDAPRRWLFVKAELGIPDEEEGASVWSLDHLFLDQDGIPTFVECKRAVDTRSRREVVAQMLDYAANGTEYWPIDRLRQAAAETAREQGAQLDDRVLALLDSDDTTDIDLFWERVEGNLRNGRIRLIFVADSIPRSLRRLVEFLNSKMADVEVLALEVKQFIGQGQKAMVPRVVGLTEAARIQKPATSSSTQTTKEAFLASCLPETTSAYEYIFKTAAQKSHMIGWGEKGFSVRLRLPESGKLASFAYGVPPNEFQFYFAYFTASEAFKSTLRQELLATGLFQESGEQTLRMRLDGVGNGRFTEVYDLILAKMDRVVNGDV